MKQRQNKKQRILPYSLGHGFELKQSHIPNAGDGVYATRAYQKGELLSEFAGELLNENEYNNLDEKNEYIIQIEDDGNIINSENVPKVEGVAIAQWINDPRNAKLYNVYAVASPDSRHIYLYAKRNIKQGEELFFNYSAGYWKQWQKIHKRQPFKLLTLS